MSKLYSYSKYQFRDLAKNFYPLISHLLQEQDSHRELIMKGLVPQLVLLVDTIKALEIPKNRVQLARETYCSPEVMSKVLLGLEMAGYVIKQNKRVEFSRKPVYYYYLTKNI